MALIRWPEEERLRWAARLQVAALLSRLVAFVPLAAFGVFVMLGTFGDGSLPVGALLLGIAVVGPVIHGVILAALHTRSDRMRSTLRLGSWTLLVLDGVTVGVFAYPALQQGGVGFPLLFVAVVGFHVANLLLAIPRSPSTGQGQEVGA